MKTILKLLGVGLFCLVSVQATRAQRLVFSTESGKNGIVNVSFSDIKDNTFDVYLIVNWTDLELKATNDKQSVIGFDPTGMELSTPFLKFIPGIEREIITFNNTVTLKFELDERFPGGDISIKFPFFVASSANAASNPGNRELFVLARPRTFLAVNKIEASKLIDKTPPKIAVVSPEGVDMGMKPIIESETVRVTLNVSDYSGVEKVTVNNLPAQRVTDSTYVVDLMLKYGYESPVTIIAEDAKGLTSRSTFTVESRRPIGGMIATSQPGIQSGAIDEKNIEPSDVDINIPLVAGADPNRYALIIGNEDYSSFQRGLKTESDVAFAIHDAETFKEYAKNVLGISEDNIIFRKNATAIEMHRAISQINTIAKVNEGKAEIFVMYAGHGFPDEKTQEPYLVPVDVSGSDLQFAIKLTDFYAKLTEFPTKRVTVFLDACFSGGGREQGLLAARAVKVRPKENPLAGNLVVFAAASGDQSAMPWEDKSHGMFTYHVLKLLKETQGNVTYGEMSDYLRTNVGTRSVIVNQKEQNPQTNISPSVEKNWKEWKVRE
ncbi:MAG TPA: caspase family protein [Tenuifilaceae bacterium]|nr:caspase family protein [Tenuifilaceae bacterium]HPE19076.1 caspase family protein [Tenuifilaceae bacterium]HPJ46526.1 caspase family protein [Tenuifilaceae bacterium]HPQ34918.1 caspase family protein [Tenuifilaceae bacterium]HRX68847.1 caspase family protein [Tenuifilaceae bacterium]